MSIFPSKQEIMQCQLDTCNSKLIAAEKQIELLMKHFLNPSSQVMVKCTECEGSGFNVHDACRDKCNTCEYSIGDDDCSQGIPDFCPTCHGKKEVGLWKRKECKNCYPDGRVPVGDPHYPEDTDMCGKCNGTKYITEPLTYRDVYKAFIELFINHRGFFTRVYNDDKAKTLLVISIDNQEWEVVLK